MERPFLSPDQTFQRRAGFMDAGLARQIRHAQSSRATDRPGRHLHRAHARTDSEPGGLGDRKARARVSCRGDATRPGTAGQSTHETRSGTDDSSALRRPSRSTPRSIPISRRSKPIKRWSRPISASRSSSKRSGLSFSRGSIFFKPRCRPSIRARQSLIRITRSS